MQQHTQELLKKALYKANHSSYALSAQMVELEVVQGAVGRLMGRIDEIVHNGWDKDDGMARLVIAEIRDTVRLIDMGFYPLFKEIKKEIRAINTHADDAFDLVVRENKKADAPTSTNEI